jgi:hypothetical protein
MCCEKSSYGFLETRQFCGSFISAGLKIDGIKKSKLDGRIRIGASGVLCSLIKPE